MLSMRLLSHRLRLHPPGSALSGIGSSGTIGSMTTLYGIPNCDTVKKARTWLTEHGVEHQFHDFKKQGVPEAVLDQWLAALGWEPLVNRKGTTWRKLDEATRAAVVDAASARALMLAQPSVIKRPVVQWTHGVTVGFDAAAWQSRR
jgi:arsenate reductase (glutaredoxin)